MSRITRQEHIRQLRSRKQKLDGEVASLHEEQKDAQCRYQERKRQRDEIDQSIRELESESDSEPTVSEHALIRYLEREKGVDLQSLREEILEGRKDEIAFMCDGKIRLPSGNALVIKGRSVVTVA